MRFLTPYNRSDTKETAPDLLVDELLGGTEIVATVREILPRKKESTLMKVAAYCRVSTKAQDQLDSLAAQEQYYEEQLQANPNWKFAGIYSDVGIGTTIKGRKRLNALNFRVQARQSRYGPHQIRLPICPEYGRFVCFIDGMSISSLKQKISIPFTKLLNFF